jgi:hypothetical protein
MSRFPKISIFVVKKGKKNKFRKSKKIGNIEIIGDIGTFDDIGTASILANNLEIV